MPLLIAGWWLLRRDRHAPRWAVGAAALTILTVLQIAFDVYQYRVN
ncbi:MAG: hypothetical protein O2973_13690 [Gemmatimonadetes bacterium]|nr:hypothetical protein [Gemmatimonadota bacterium]